MEKYVKPTLEVISLELEESILAASGSLRMAFDYDDYADDDYQ